MCCNLRRNIVLFKPESKLELAGERFAINLMPRTPWVIEAVETIDKNLENP